MERIQTTIRIIISAIQEILEFWFSLSIKAAIVAFVVLLSSFIGAAIVIEIVARWVAPFLESDLPSIFTPPYLVALCLIYIPIFIYLLLYYSAHSYKEVELVANKLKWKDIEVKLLPLSKDDIISLALVIKNKKPFTLEKVKVNLVYQEVAKEDRTHSNSWQLGWLDDRKFSWEEKNIGSGERVQLALFRAYFWDEGVNVFIPGPDGQPKDRKSIGGFDTKDKFLIIDLSLNATVDGQAMESKTVRVMGEIIDKNVYVRLNNSWRTKIKVFDNG